MFNNLSDRLNDTFDRLRGKGKLTEADITSAMRDIRMALLEADVNFKVVKDFVAKTKERCMTADVLESLTPAQNVVKIVLDELVELLGSTESKLVLSSRIPNVIMLVGLQGSGKTTAAVKLAYMLKKQGRSPLLAACDVYRPAAADQLATLGGEIGVPVFRGDGAHPVEIAQGAIKEAVDHLRDVVIVDTAGRLQIDEQMMQEAVDIKRAVKPDQVLMVVDAMTGQDIVNVVSTFAERTDFDGVIISKLDGDARGGGALSVRAVTGKPIKFVSMGEKPESLEVFSPDRMAKRILGMGDVVGIIEKAQEVADAEQMEAAERMLREGLTMDDMLEQMRAVRKMGGMKGILGMLPGGQRALNQMGGNVDESILDKNEAMIQSMTKAERLNPKCINGQRRARIARGSGTTPTDVNNLLKQWGEMNKMMGKMRAMAQQAGAKKGKKGKKGKKMRVPGMPGMANLGSLMGGGNPLAGMGGMGGSGSSDMDMLRAMEQQMKGRKF
ncbi:MULTISPECIES: signal recognition particle protein [Collinsella]|uniref:signal recognition particle protein n=1 Tax=Collinsella TaxID=102106 RepID=UPI000B36832E|nr:MULTISPECIES: signal recognition particle protein [Collinsella]MBM6682506.1 signal recognition particle protein [Collinsella intestinalis]OUN47183.1 signal recognition particle protein [Collinsella sp. An7]